MLYLAWLATEKLPGDCQIISTSGAVVTCCHVHTAQQMLCGSSTHVGVYCMQVLPADSIPEEGCTARSRGPGSGGQRITGQQHVHTDVWHTLYLT